MSQVVELPPVRCPSCGSTQVQGGQRGFGAGKAIGGGLLLGPIGLAAGFHGSKDVELACLSCGARWRPQKPPPKSLGLGGWISIVLFFVLFYAGCKLLSFLSQ